MVYPRTPSTDVNVFMVTTHVIRTSPSIDSRIIGSTDRL
jgi:hypothetical protein